MTKYDGDPIGIRAGRKGKFVLGKDRKKSMEEFLKTGKHPLLEYTREENAKSVLPPLPTVDVNRPHIFMDVKQRSGVRGRIVVELFEDLYPSLCVPFRNRCLEVRSHTWPTARHGGNHLRQNTACRFAGIPFHQEHTY